MSREVDERDVGGGIVNIFIDTKEPKRCFEEAMQIINDMESKPAAAGVATLKRRTMYGYCLKTI